MPTVYMYEVKNNNCFFGRLFRVKKNGVFLFGISFSVLEIFRFLYRAKEGSDDVIPLKRYNTELGISPEYWSSDLQTWHQ